MSDHDAIPDGATVAFDPADSAMPMPPVDVEPGVYGVPEHATELIDKTTDATAPAEVADALADARTTDVALTIAMYDLPRVGDIA